MRPALFWPAPVAKRRWCSPWTESASGPPRPPPWAGEPPGDFAGDSFSAFAGPAVLDVYLLSRLSRELWKVQGDWTGPVRQPKYARTIPDTLADVKPDNSFHLNLEYFDYCTGLRMTNGRFDALVGGRPRGPE